MAEFEYTKKRISPDKLRDTATKILCAYGVPEDEAYTLADILVLTDMRAIYSHGVFRMRGNVKGIVGGGFRTGVELKIIDEGPSFARCDAQGGIGIVQSVKATKLAIEKAKTAGIAMVNVFNSHHDGALGIYSTMISDEGMYGFSMSTAGPLMAVTGSRTKALGNNPYSYSVPAGKYRAITLDIACSTMASGKLCIYEDRGWEIPDGVMLDKNGNMTHDPTEQYRGGVLLPFADHKGYGMGLMVETFAGILSGAAFLRQQSAWNANPDRIGNIGHMFMAINPALINPGLDVNEKVEKTLDDILSQPLRDGYDRIMYPGQPEWECEDAAKEKGIPLPDTSIGAILETAEKAGVEITAESMEM